jgi:RHS repeat-associated protein
VTTTEANQISTLAADNRAKGTAIDDASYNVDADLNRDGVVNVFDLNVLNGNWGAALADGRLSSGSGGTDNVVGYAGYIFNAEIAGAGLYTVRHRHYDPDLGRWLERDPLGLRIDATRRVVATSRLGLSRAANRRAQLQYEDGMNIYQYVRSTPMIALDPFGLLSIKCFHIDGAPGSHCWIDFGDGDVGSGHAPPNWPLPGSIDIYCGPYSESPDCRYRRDPRPNDPLGPERPTPIKCPPGTDRQAIKNCVKNILKRIAECEIPYRLTGPNSNTVAWVAYQKCMRSRGCTLRAPNTMAQ